MNELFLRISNAKFISLCEDEIIIYYVNVFWFFSSTNYEYRLTKEFLNYSLFRKILYLLHETELRMFSCIFCQCHLYIKLFL